MDRLKHWQNTLRCPLDRGALTLEGEVYRCASCDFQSVMTTVRERDIPDLRALGIAQTISLPMHIPVQPLDRYQLLDTHFHAITQNFVHYSREEIRRLFKTKIDKGIQYYCQQLLKTHGADAPILDLGCGSGGTRRYLESLGFNNVLAVDWIANGADLLVDAHRLPLADSSVQMVISTAVFEHLYNPFLAMSEIARVLKSDGCFVGGASFWEGWHGSSYFHLSPDGWNALLLNAGLTFDDLWPGWGIIPAAFTHVWTPGKLRGLGYALQSGVDTLYRLLRGESGLRKMQLRASGSYQVYARKKA